MLNEVFIEFFSAIKNKKIRFLLSSIILFIVAVIALIPIYLTLASRFSGEDSPPPPLTQEIVSQTKEDTSQEKVKSEKDIIEERYTGCDIKGSSGKYISSNIEINAPTGFSIINYKEVPKEGNETIIESRSNLSNPTFKDGKKFTAKCVGNGKVKKVLGIVVDHYNAWRMSDIILTLEKNEK